MTDLTISYTLSVDQQKEIEEWEKAVHLIFGINTKINFIYEFKWDGTKTYTRKCVEHDAKIVIIL